MVYVNGSSLLRIIRFVEKVRYGKDRGKVYIMFYRTRWGKIFFFKNRVVINSFREGGGDSVFKKLK